MVDRQNQVHPWLVGIYARRNLYIMRYRTLGMYIKQHHIVNGVACRRRARNKRISAIITMYNITNYIIQK